MKMSKMVLQAIAYGFAHEFNNSIFRLRLPFVIKITKSKKKSAQQYAEILSDSEGHIITLDYLRHCRDIDELKNSIFHEFVHAVQAEKGLDLEHDGFFWSFEKKAAKIGLTIRFPNDNYGDFVK